MALFDIFKTPRIRRYDHKPIYWDPAKERREERLAKAKQELGMNEEDQAYKPMIRKGTFQEQRKTKSLNKQSQTLKLFLIVLVIIALVYWLI